MTKLFYFLKPYRAILGWVLLLLFMQTFGTLYLPTLTADIVNIGVVNGSTPFIFQTGGKMLLVAASTAAVAVAATYLSSRLSSGVGRDIRNALFTKAQDFSIHDFNKFGAASMITRSTGDVTQIQQAMVMSLQMLIPAPFMAMGGLLLAFSKDRVMALVIVATVLLFVFVTVLIGKKAMPLFARLQTGMDQINRTLRENITGVRVIRAFNRENAEQARLNETFGGYAAISIRVNEIFAVLMPAVLLIMNLCTLCIVWLGGIRVGAGYLQIGDIMALIEYAALILYYLIMGIMTFMILPRAAACAARISEVLSLRPEITDPEGAVADCGAPDLEFRDVTFRYHGAEEPVLSGLNFTARAGGTTAVIGGTGSGKSTVASLIPRFYDIQAGSILVGGVDIRALSQNTLRGKIGFVPQKAFLFSGTVADNLRDGKPDASMEELRHAARIAQADEFIGGLERGYESRVAQGGGNFSGGQKQRLCIARALVRKPEIYVFDDSFSALDFQTDAKLRAALKDEVRDAVVILVAQRVSTIMDADQIIVLDEGRIAGIGRHAELMEGCELYRQIARSQLSEEELK